MLRLALWLKMCHFSCTFNICKTLNFTQNVTYDLLAFTWRFLSSYKSARALLSSLEILLGGSRVVFNKLATQARNSAVVSFSNCLHASSVAWITSFIGGFSGTTAKFKPLWTVEIYGDLSWQVGEMTNFKFSTHLSLLFLPWLPREILSDCFCSLRSLLNLETCHSLKMWCSLNCACSI